MKKDYTDIVIVLDRSGSMSSVKDDTIGGFNTFLEQQQAAPGVGTITLVQFDDIYEKRYEGINLSDAQRLNSDTFVPRGCTALLDAIGRSITETGERLSKLKESDRPDKVVFVILTDGHENASVEYDAKHINEMISHQRDVYKWEFVFLGANQDAIATASQLGVSVQNAMSYAANSVGTRRAFAAVSKNLVSYRAGKADAGFTKQDRDDQDDAGLDVLVQQIRTRVK